MRDAKDAERAHADQELPDPLEATEHAECREPDHHQGREHDHVAERIAGEAGERHERECREHGGRLADRARPSIARHRGDQNGHRGDDRECRERIEPHAGAAARALHQTEHKHRAMRRVSVETEPAHQHEEQGELCERAHRIIEREDERERERAGDVRRDARGDSGAIREHERARLERERGAAEDPCVRGRIGERAHQAPRRDAELRDHQQSVVVAGARRGERGCREPRETQGERGRADEGKGGERGCGERDPALVAILSSQGERADDGDRDWRGPAGIGAELVSESEREDERRDEDQRAPPAACIGPYEPQREVRRDREERWAQIARMRVRQDQQRHREHRS